MTLWPKIIVGAVVLFLGFQAYMFFSKGHPRVPVKPVIVKTVQSRPKSAKEFAGYIAIVLDDWGYNRSHCKYISSFDAPVATAILPGLPFSKDILACTKAAGQEAMLHLPIEPYVSREKYPKDYMLTTEMSQSEVRASLKRNLDDFPGIIGVNNHEGSKGTEAPELMTTILTDLKRRGLFFVDSVTTGRSACGDVASKVGVLFAKRNVFLDNRGDRGSIERQFALAARISAEKGSVLVIGHDRALTLQILEEQIHKLKDQGFVFVTVKDLIKAQRK